jgi:RNA polymerase sigma-70 factor (ECF subfamily)
MLRAWKSSDRYEPRAQLTTWLHAIATNVCLTTIARTRKRPAELIEDLEHLQPYPDRLIDDLVERETVELAFITAIQLLSPKQRAVLILRDVLGWSAKEAAEALDDSVAAVTSALQRARVGLKKRRMHAPAPNAQERAVVQRFMTAWDEVDIDGLVSLLSEDAVMTMPPERMRVAGARAIGDFFGSVPQGGRLNEIRLVPTSTNRQPALAAYSRGDDGKHRPYGLMVLQDRRRPDRGDPRLPRSLAVRTVRPAARTDVGAPRDPGKRAAPSDEAFLSTCQSGRGPFVVG